MKNNIKNTLQRINGHSFMIMIALLFVLYGQGFAQWKKTNFPFTVQVNTLAIIDSNIFAGTDGDGIFVSTDNGENWIDRNAGLQSKVIHKIFIDSTTIFAGTDSGAYISTNNGLKWNSINSGLSGLGVWSFEASNSGDSTILAGTSDGIYFSTDYGKNWEVTGLPHTSMPVHSMAAHNNYVFAATLAGGVFYSEDNGFGWKDISIINSGTNTHIVTLIPVYSLAIIDTNVIAGAGPKYLYYTSYTSIADDPFVQMGAHGNDPILCFTMHDSILFAGNSIGYIFLSDSNGLAWKSLSPPSVFQPIYSLALNNSYIFAGTGKGVWRLQYPETTTNVENFKEVPAGFELEQNYPNPFNPSTTIRYSIPEAEHVTLKVYDELGREIKTLVDENKQAGQHEVQFNGSGLASGIYYYRITSGKFSEVKKLILMK